MQRVLSVSLSHAIRGAALVLLPFAFIALVAWATAGSSTGTTTDPIRGAIWLWLGSHHIPFQLSLPPSGLAGYFSYLPWGAMVLPFFAVRTTFNRALDRLQGDFHDIKGVRLIYSLFYTVIVTGLSYLSASTSVKSQWYLAPLFAFAIALSATMTCGGRVKLAKPVDIAVRLIAIILGVSSITVGILIFINFEQVKLLTEGLQPGVFGGILLLILSLLYLPNAAVAVASYFAGTGFSVGEGTLVSPWWYEINQLPVFPLLGIIPLDRNPMWIVAGLLFLGIGALMAYWTLQSGVQLLLQSAFFFALALTLIAYLSSGSLMTAEMASMGVSIWKFGLTALLEVLLGAGITTLIISKLQR